MSISAPKEFWDKRAIIDCIHKDTIVSIMKMSVIELDSRINLANVVLKSHSESKGILDGKLSDEMFDCITQYKDMLSIAQNNPLQFNVPINLNLGFGNGGLRSYIS